MTEQDKTFYGPEDRCFGCEHHDNGCRHVPDGGCPHGFHYKVSATRRKNHAKRIRFMEEVNKLGLFSPEDILDELTALRQANKELQADIRCMVEKAAVKHLPAYREQSDNLLAQTIRAEKAEAENKQLVGAADKTKKGIDKEIEAKALLFSENLSTKRLLQKRAEKAEATVARLTEALRQISLDEIGYGLMDYGQPTSMAKIAKQALADIDKLEPGEPDGRD